MGNLLTLTRREIGTLFLAPALHLATAFFVFVYSLLFMLVIFTEQIATFDSMAIWVCFMSMFLAPLITMRSFAEERGSGTIELLLTAPVQPAEVVLSKFLGCFSFYIATLLPLGVHVALLAYCGKLDPGATAANLLGLVLSGALFVAIGLLASSLTSSQVVAAAGGTVANLILLFLSTLAEEGAGALAVVGSISFVPHFKGTFATGIITTSALTYFLTVPAGVLFLTWIGLRSRGMLSRSAGRIDRRRALLAGGCLAVACILLLGGLTWLHVEGIGPAELRSRLAPVEKTTAVAEGLESVFAPPPEEAESKTGWLYLLPFGLSAVALVLSAVFWRGARGEESEGWLSLLRRREVWPTLVTTLAVMVILVNLNYLAAYPLGALRSEGAPLSWLAVLQPRTWDLTETGENTLHIDTRTTLDELTDPVEITVFYSSAIDYEGVRMRADTEALLERFAAYSAMVQPVFVDAELDRMRALKLAARMGLKPQFLHQAAVVEYKGRSTLVSAGMCLKPPDAVAVMAGHKQYTYNGEMAFTIAVKRLMDPRSIRVYFTDGHGEFGIDSADRTPRKVGRFAEALGRETMEVRRHFLRDEPIPSDCDVLILPGPMVPFAEPEIERLQNYVDRGGRVMLMLPAVVQPTRRGQEALSDPRLAALLKEWGGRPRADTLFDHKVSYGKQAVNIYGLASQEHPITGGGRTVRCVLPGARSLVVNSDASRKGWQVDRLLVSPATTRSQQKVADEYVSRDGPFTLAFTAEKQTEPGLPNARVAVFGNVELVSNLALDVEHNQALAVSTVHWLAGRDYGIRVEPPAYVDRKLKMTPPQQRLIAWVTLLWLPAGWVLLAVGVWWVRKE